MQLHVPSLVKICDLCVPMPLFILALWTHTKSEQFAILSLGFVFEENLGLKKISCISSFFD